MTGSTSRAKRRGYSRFLALALVMTLALVFLSQCVIPGESRSPLRNAGSLFEIVELDSVYNLDDAGVGDLNADGHLDLWTTNHSSLQWIALGASDAQFSPGGVDKLHLHQDPEVPGIEAKPEAPACSASVKRVFIQESAIVLDNLGAADSGAFAGKLYMPWPSEAITSEHSDWHELDCPTRVPCTHGSFRIDHDNDLRLQTIPDRSDGFPITVELDPATQLGDVRFGGSCVVPSQHRVEFSLKDRHGVVLADFTGSDAADLFVSRGGARGRLNEVHPGALDELFVWREDAFEEQIEDSGIRKNGCPGRQTSAVDIDRDGDLDIYQVCGRASGDNASAANRLYIQTSRGKFEERAAEWGLAVDGAGSFAWVPAVDPAEMPRFVWAAANSIRILEYDGERYAERWRETRQSRAEDALLVGDIDSDGEFEVVVVSRRENAVVELDDEDSSLVPFATFGLPDNSVAGNLVDFDGNGSLELFLVPQGLYRRNGSGSWHDTGLLAIDVDGFVRTGGIRDARSSWFDADSDGDLDLWLMLEDELIRSDLRRAPQFLGPNVAPFYKRAVEIMIGPRAWRSNTWRSLLFMRKTDRPTHVAVQVVGSTGNREAIGARIIASGGGRTDSLIVGHSDGALLSQTLHDVYLGIAGVESFEFLTVIFPEGEVVTVQDIEPTSLPTLIHPKQYPDPSGEIAGSGSE